jgi:hypothetical protein
MKLEAARALELTDRKSLLTLGANAPEGQR